ncbi:hypothetical protein HPB51_016241 [Rhipicephalus microplus]|uniref:Uncharacterized protein n=1 Tax=Rhipicephalus microplus TaxID=6941 RepID=A0A9J6EHJ5_RHIMP|nr:hypothetical protein HPB51_016241 [Rhipicephalus microplus]
MDTNATDTVMDYKAHIEASHIKQHRADQWIKLKLNAMPTVFPFRVGLGNHRGTSFEPLSRSSLGRCEHAERVVTLYIGSVGNADFRRTIDPYRTNFAGEAPLCLTTATFAPTMCSIGAALGAALEASPELAGLRNDENDQHYEEFQATDTSATDISADSARKRRHGQLGLTTTKKRAAE